MGFSYPGCPRVRDGWERGRRPERCPRGGLPDPWPCSSPRSSRARRAWSSPPRWWSWTSTRSAGRLAAGGVVGSSGPPRLGGEGRVPLIGVLARRWVSSRGARRWGTSLGRAGIPWSHSPGPPTAPVSMCGRRRPRDLSPIYPCRRDDPMLGAVLLSALAATAAITGSCSPCAEMARAPAAWIAYLIFLGPMSGIVPFGRLRGAVDRYTYVACLGWALVAGGAIVVSWRAARGGQGSRVRPGLRGHSGVALAVMLLVWSLCSWRQAAVWRDGVTLWTRAVAIVPARRWRGPTSGRRLPRGETSPAPSPSTAKRHCGGRDAAGRLPESRPRVGGRRQVRRGSRTIPSAGGAPARLGGGAPRPRHGRSTTSTRRRGRRRLHAGRGARPDLGPRPREPRHRALAPGPEGRGRPSTSSRAASLGSSKAPEATISRCPGPARPLPAVPDTLPARRQRGVMHPRWPRSGGPPCRSRRASAPSWTY